MRCQMCKSLEAELVVTTPQETSVKICDLCYEQLFASADANQVAQLERNQDHVRLYEAEIGGEG